MTEAAIAQVATLVMGTSPKGESYNRSGIGLALLNGPTEFGPTHPVCSLFTTDAKRTALAGDLLFCVRGSTTGRMNWADRTYAVGRGVAAIRGKNQLETRYIRYCLEALLPALLQHAGGGTFPNLRRDEIAEFRIPYREDRLQVAALLAAYDDLIDNNLQRVRLLEDMARRHFEHWFVKDQGVSGLEITERSISDVATPIRGRSYRKSEIPEAGGVPFLNLKCIDRGGGFRRTGIKRYTGPYKEQQKTLRGDVVVAMTDMTQERNIVGQVARVPKLDEDFGVISLDLLRLVPTNIDPTYLYGALRYTSFSDEIRNFANGANVLHLSPSRVAEYRIPCPSAEIQSRYGSTVLPLYELMDNLQLQNGTLQAARDSLLPKLVAGEIDTSNVDIDTSWLAA